MFLRERTRNGFMKSINLQVKLNKCDCFLKGHFIWLRAVSLANQEKPPYDIVLIKKRASLTCLGQVYIPRGKFT